LIGPGADSGLSFEQAPPLAIPASFFVTAPLAVAAAGFVLLAHGNLPWLSPWEPSAVALVHLGTLGLITMVMFGALYQILPVVAGAVVPAPRLARAVHAGLTVGAAALAAGMLLGEIGLLWCATLLLGATLLAFLIPTGMALARAQTRDDTVTGIKVAWGALALAAALGVTLATLYALKWSPDLRRERLICHWTLAGIGWIGGLLSAVSWQVIPMFYLTPPCAARVRRATLALLSGTIVATVAVFALRVAQPWPLLAAAPGAAAVWIIHPLWAQRALSARRRKRVDDSILFWRLGLAVAPAMPVLAALAHLLPDPRLSALAGWCGIWGWAGLIIHGMMSRIVPFLVWFHRLAHLVGKQPTPSAKQLLPRHRLRLAFGLHAATLASGCVGILLGEAAIARVTGVLLVLTGAAMLAWLLPVLRFRLASLA